MKKFAVDYSKLQGTLDGKKAYRLEDVKDRVRKVAFDVVRFMDSSDNIDGLWQIQHADDGDYIVAMYDEKDSNKEATSSNWSVILDKRSSNLNIFYKNSPVTKIASSDAGIPKEEMHLAESYLPRRLAENEKLATSLLKSLSGEGRKALLTQHPELIKLTKEEQEESTAAQMVIVLSGKTRPLPGFAFQDTYRFLRDIGLQENKDYTIMTLKEGAKQVWIIGPRVIGTKYGEKQAIIAEAKRKLPNMKVIVFRKPR
jgi:hypothetical protein